MRPARTAALAAAVAAIATLCGLTPTAHAISRDQVMVRAKAFAYHPWRCTTTNLTASCSSIYQSAYVPGDYVGLPYDWGGYMTLFEFDQQIAQGYGAGSSVGDELDCTAGLDCSGFVSKCWDTGHYSTSSFDQISTAIAQTSLLPGDALNQAGYHVVLYSHALANGDPVYFEAMGYNVHLNASGGWSSVSGFTPRRFESITGTTAGNPVGTTENPILIGSFPFTDSRDTRQSASDVLDGCAAAPGNNESGPEYIYQATFTQPGVLTVSVSDDAATDIDVHLYGAMNTGDCLARADATFSQPVDCGTYYIVADTFRNPSGKDLAGPYTLTAAFVPSGKPCGSGPPSYAPKGKLGDACGYSGNPSLPFCNENFGAVTCIYSTASKASFCSKPCKSVTDCAVFPGGCCEDLGQGEFYCLISSFCSKPSVDARVPDAKAQDGGPLPVLDGPQAAVDGGGYPSDGSSSDGAASAGDGKAPPPGDGGCQCRMAGGGRPGEVMLLLLFIAGFWSLRRWRRE
jgi:hypothetical protein